MAIKKDTLKAMLSDYLNKQGITNLNRNFKCLNPEHQDNKPSMRYYEDTQTVHCFGCNVTYDIFDLYAVQHLNATMNSNNRVNYSESFKALYNQVAEYMGVTNQKLKVTPEDAENTKIREFNNKLIQIAKQHLSDTDYLQKRGISNSLAQKFGVGFIRNWVNPTVAIKTGKELASTPRLIIPLGSSDYLARDTRENIPDEEKKYEKIKQGKSRIFNMRALLQDKKPIFIVEGEIDALSILEVTDQAEAVALGSTSNVDLFCSLVRKINQDKVHKNLAYDPVFLIALDNDNAGHLASKELQAQLSSNTLSLTNYTVNIAKNSKDANEELVYHHDKFVKEVDARIKDPDDYLTSFIKRIVTRKNHPQYIPTGLDELDDLLDGGLYPQLYVLGAVSSVGKTTFLMQVADQIASKKINPIFYYSLETSKDELTEKNLSRLTYELSPKVGGNPQTARSINNGYWLDHGKNQKLVNEAIRIYEEYYNMINIFDGTLNRPTAGNIYQQVKNYRRKFPDVKPVIIVDYLQILKPMDDRDTDKEKVTKSIAMFKTIASELDVPVIVISSFNRASYQNPVALTSFKESGEIEYYADTLLGLQYKAIRNSYDGDEDAMEEAVKKIPRQLELTILKNRNGQSNTSIDLNYDPRFNDFY